MTDHTAVGRTVFSTPRSAEFLELEALQSQTGQPSEYFGDVVVKESIDNALDAAESVGRAPVIELSTHIRNEVAFITVADNGGGIAPEVVARLCDFDMLTSDKARYRGPTRGSQGNALKTLLGMPYAFGVNEPVVIESMGVRHEIRVSVDKAGDVAVTDDKSTSERTVGTSITVPVSEDAWADLDQWAFGAALVNPHASFSVSDPGQNGIDAEPTFYKSAGQAWSKWPVQSAGSPHWYTLPAFSTLIHSHLRAGDNKAIGGFIAEFDGLSGSTKQKAIRKAVPGVTHLSDLEDDDDAVRALFGQMLWHAKAVPPQRMGAVGHDHLRRMLDERYGVQRSWYRVETAVVNGIPWVIEVAVAEIDEAGDVWFACNHSPSFGDPLGNAPFIGDDGVIRGAEEYLRDAGATNGVSGFRRAAVIHVICAAAQFTDKGKVELVVTAPVVIAAMEALDKASKVLRKEAEKRRKDAVRADRAHAESLRDERRNEMSRKAAVFKVMAEAKKLAGHVVAARTLYYKVRPLIQKYTKAVLGYGYFSDLLAEYERDVAKLDGLYYEARGKLVHPHDDGGIELGTREVAGYVLPSYQFDKVMFVEKMGLEAQLEPYQIGQKTDMAIIYSKGYSVTACRDLLARPEFDGMKKFTLHDADRDGYGIARTLGSPTDRMPDHDIDIIDLGLTVPQAIAEGLETEEVKRTVALPEALLDGLDDQAKEWFTGEAVEAGDGKVHYRTKRCELNAFSADGLVKFIYAQLAIHGVHPKKESKVVPPSDVLDGHVDGERDRVLADMVQAEIEAMIDIEAIVARLRESHDEREVTRDDIRATFDGEGLKKSWRSAADKIVADEIDGRDGVTESIRELITEQLDPE